MQNNTRKCRKSIYEVCVFHNHEVCIIFSSFIYLFIYKHFIPNTKDYKSLDLGKIREWLA